MYSEEQVAEALVARSRWVVGKLRRYRRPRVDAKADVAKPGAARLCGLTARPSSEMSCCASNDDTALDVATLSPMSLIRERR